MARPSEPGTCSWSRRAEAQVNIRMATMLGLVELSPVSTVAFPVAHCSAWLAKCLIACHCGLVVVRMARSRKDDALSNTEG